MNKKKNILKVNVTAAIITRARKLIKGGSQRTRHCPVTLAICKAAKVAAEVDVGSWNGGCMINGVVHNLPIGASEFINNFDAKRRVRPFKFELDLSDEA